VAPIEARYGGGEECNLIGPTREELKKISGLYGFGLGDSELDVFLQYINQEIIPSYNELERMVEQKPQVKYPRDLGRAPREEENEFGAWAWKCSATGSRRGPLSGKKIALKDNIALAGVPMMIGSAVMEGFIPDVDATVVTRILDAGGEIVGKAICENLCLSGGSYTSYPWPVHNPHNKDHMTGGSSSGSAVLVATREVDMALGGDQGGSIRIPASWCGVFVLKPTWGLVPYTGISSAEATLDHVGPMASKMKDVALLLEVIAGWDGLDPRQGMGDVPKNLPKYTDSLSGKIAGIRVGVLKEGFDWKDSDTDVDKMVRASAEAFREMGATVTDVSLPMHRKAAHILDGVVWEGVWSVLRDETAGHGWLGYYDTSALEFFASARRSRAIEFPIMAKLIMIAGHFIADKYHSKYYAKAQNLRYTLRSAYDNALQKYDMLLMPTVPYKARRFRTEQSLLEFIISGWSMTHNTGPSNLTGHPAINVPCGKSGGLPVGTMLVGKSFDEGTIMNAAYAYELKYQ